MKNYKRIDELSKAEVVQGLKADKFSVYCRVCISFAIAVSQKSDTVIAFSHGEYDGFCLLYPEDAINCIKNGRVKLTRAQGSTANFVTWSKESPFKESFPIGEIVSWRGIEQPSEPKFVDLVFNPSVVAAYTQTMDSLNKNEGSDFSRLMTELSNSFKQKRVGVRPQLTYRPITVHELDLVIEDRREREKDAVSFDEEGKSEWLLRCKLEAGGVKATRLAVLVYRILVSEGKLTNKNVWRRIEDSVRSGTDDFGVADVVSRLSDTELYWKDEYGHQHPCKQKTLNNLLTQLRKLQ